jgi:alkanesulfonate monooxygenase SsuD/methylene tetrahydromethanopterin reductase-like flavin-dependent oxidoreductase (luciferase family)
MSVRFGITASATGEPGLTDRDLYRDLLRDVDNAVSLGFTSAWVIEHHFSNYFPTPNPLMVLAHLAARHPELGLGTCVLVAPWHNPVRLAEEIAMLSVLTEQELFMGMGRGTAKFEYDAFGLNMGEAASRFEESIELIRTALRGEEFTFAGDHYAVPEPVVLRPVTNPDRIHIFGALGTPSSAEKIARMGLPPLSRVTGPVSEQAPIVGSWREAFADHHPGEPVPTEFPIMISCIVEDTEAGALAKAQLYVPMYMQAQLDHYTPDATNWAELPDYKAWIPQFESMRRLTKPENIPTWLQGQFVGTPETVAATVQEYIDAGFNHFLVQTATPGIPQHERDRWLTRFAKEVLPLVPGARQGDLLSTAAGN